MSGSLHPALILVAGALLLPLLRGRQAAHPATLATMGPASLTFPVARFDRTYKPACIFQPGLRFLMLFTR